MKLYFISMYCDCTPGWPNSVVCSDSCLIKLEEYPELIVKTGQVIQNLFDLKFYMGSL